MLVQSNGEPLTMKIVQDRVAGARAIQELAGHEDLSTTQRYMHLSPAAIQGAIRLLDHARPATGLGDILETEEQETAKASG